VRSGFAITACIKTGQCMSRKNEQRFCDNGMEEIKKLERAA
jgi:hypothetical protein